ncbi:MAG TPA: VOC family protein [Gemmatimonadaceae bacterium]|nr:VOC family protein [Gemmatimonadaceae bacterium]
MAQQLPTLISSSVDHLVYATVDLDRGIRELESLLGVRATDGGRHPGRGTRNALLALGDDTYLEVIAPDPDQPPPPSERWFAIDRLTTSRLVAWAAKTSDVDAVHDRALQQGVPLGDVRAGSRRQPDGVELSWRFTDPGHVVAAGVVPFFIDWGQSPHPARSAAKGATLVELRAEHPDAPTVRRMFETLGIQIFVRECLRPALVAVIEGRHGRVEIR